GMVCAVDAPSVTMHSAPYARRPREGYPGDASGGRRVRAWALRAGPRSPDAYRALGAQHVDERSQPTPDAGRARHADGRRDAALLAPDRRNHRAGAGAGPGGAPP